MTYNVLINPRGPDLAVLKEDFDSVAGYFADIVRDKSWSALPSGVIDTFVPSKELYGRFVFEADDFRGYRLDSDDYLAADKSIIGAALSRIEGKTLLDADFTLCPSVSMGLLFTMLAMRRKDIGTVVAELPAYFGCIDQAVALGLRTLLWPTLPTERYSIMPEDVRYIRQKLDGPILLLLTQPRYTMGYLRPPEFFADVRAELRAGDLLVVDEAADQSVLASLGKLDFDGAVPLIRIRGLLKGLGLNSARVAAIFHPNEWRPWFSDIVDYAGGNFDSASLKVATSICSEPKQYADLLSAAQRYVQGQKLKLDSLLRGLPMALSPLESGYIGTAHVSFDVPKSTFFAERARFLAICREERMPVVVGSSMYFPYDFQSEMFRINYFVPEEGIFQSGRAISNVIRRFNESKTGQVF
jgi:hypothetical protein